MARFSRAFMVPDEGDKDIFEKRGYSPPKGSKVTPDDFPNLPKGPAPGARPVNQQPPAPQQPGPAHTG